MSKTTIRLITRQGTELFVSANILEGGLVAVHPVILNENGDLRKNWYTVTHIPTGKTILSEVRGQKRAIHCAELLNLPCLKGNRFIPIPKPLRKALQDVDIYLRETVRMG